MVKWVATAYGALDLRGWHENQSEVEVMVLPTKPAEPLGLAGPHARLWFRLTDGPISDEDLEHDEQALVREYAEVGIAASDPNHPARVRKVSPPWLMSPLHELVCALIGSVARDHGIRLVFIKGPALHRQGLRDREHSGDVDAWVDPARVPEVVAHLEKWGWALAQSLWAGAAIYHSFTMTPGPWGCEIDVHRHMPGCAITDPKGFEILLDHTEAMDFAGVPVLVPQAPAHAVLMALHLMRPQFGRKVAGANEETATRVLKLAGQSASEFSSEIRADAALQDVLNRAFPNSETQAAYRAPLNWRWRAEPDTFKRHLVTVVSSPIVIWPRLIYRLIWPDAATAMRADRLNGGNAKSALEARTQRLKRGLLRHLRRRR